MKRIIKYIFSALLSIVILILLYFIIANVVATKNNSIAKFFGYSISYVPTNSMEPTINANSTIIFDQDYKYDDLNKGDIIVYFNNEENIYVIHRIVDKTELGFVTKGDNNSICDYSKETNDYYYITSANYVGKYTKTITAFSLNSSLSRFLVIVLIVTSFGFIVVSEVFSIKKTVRQSEKDDDKEKIKRELIEEIKQELNNKD